MVGEAEASFVRRGCGTPSFSGVPTTPSDEEATSMGDILTDIFSSHQTNLSATSPQDLFGILDLLETPQETSRFISLIEEKNKASDLKLPVLEHEPDPNISALDGQGSMFAYTKKSKVESEPKKTRVKAVEEGDEEEVGDAPRMTHIAVERNRRKQMNEHLAVLRSLMPGFYVQRGDQASIIGGVIEFIKELQQVLQSLESKRQRKAVSPSASPRGLMGPPTPQATTPLPLIRAKPPPNLELVSNSKSAVADVELKIVGSNALLKTLSHKIPGQILKLLQTLENLSLEILHLNVSTIDDTVLNSFTLKIGIECNLSVEEVAQAVQQTFSAELDLGRC